VQARTLRCFGDEIPGHDAATEDDTSRVFFAVWPDAGACASLASLAHDCAAQTGGRAAFSSNLRPR
jgi:hypothetical protein